MKVKNIALTISILGFAIGFSELQENVLFWMGRPVGAIAFIVYFIFMVLEKEGAVLDRQMRRVEKRNEKAVKTGASKRSHKENDVPAFTTATSH